MILMMAAIRYLRIFFQNLESMYIQIFICYLHIFYIYYDYVFISNFGKHVISKYLYAISIYFVYITDYVVIFLPAYSYFIKLSL
jgi:hypothetical protein